VCRHLPDVTRIQLRRRSEIMSEPNEGSGRGCDGIDAGRSTRRTFLTVMSFLGLDLAADAIPAWAEPASERPKEGDVLVAIDAEKPVALETKDIPVGGPPVLAWPMDLADQQILECSCHYSHYNPREAAAVMDGPATRSLAALPLKIVDGKLTVAKPFTGRVGIVPT
jgi:nitrite reductase/ring-hydroxylating ferredoxin subunit